MIVCIDTNVLVGMFGRAAPWLPIRQALLDERFLWALSTEILLEYEEIFAREMGTAKAASMVEFIELVHETRDAIRFISPDFRFLTIPADTDDDKFADCAIAAHADYIITEDRHFLPLANAGYKPQPISPGEFISRCLQRGGHGGGAEVAESSHRLQPVRAWQGVEAVFWPAVLSPAEADDYFGR